MLAACTHHREPPMTVEVYAITCGWLTMPMPFLLDGTEGDCRIPIPSYFIRHPQGTLLFDSGMSERVQAGGAAALGPELEPFFQIHFEPNEVIGARLEQMEVDPGAVDYLVSSHLHFDHCGGHEQIPNARHVIQKREWAAAQLPEGRAANHYNPADFDHGHDRIEADGEHDIFGDGSVICVPTYGHTPGHQSLLLKTAGGEMVLCGDACYLRQTLEEMRLPAEIAVNDPQAMRASLETLRNLQQRGATMMYGHDAGFWADVPQAPARLA